jgi:uncharacterized protein YacL
MPSRTFFGTRFDISTVLRFVLAIVFALIAFIFTEVIPDIPPFNRIFLRVSITLWFGLMGYGLFPDLARIISSSTIHLVNTLATRVTSEVMTQILRLQTQNPLSHGSFTSSSASGGVTLSQPIIIDTSALIDGRILDIAKTSFLLGTILVPTFVLTELQQVADSADYLKRTRGRRGFEIIDELKKIKGLRLEVWDRDVAAKAVDDKLIKLARSLKGRIITTDYNLNRVASVTGVTVLNINDLANSLKTVAVPGEPLTIKMVHIGKDPKQAVGYLNDGTMVVLENGADMVGKEVTLEVTRLLQASAGKMIFGKLLKSSLKR